MIAPKYPNEEDDVLAGEYVLGMLGLSERLSVEARLKDDAVFADAVAKWEADFAPLNAGYPEVKAPNLLPKIEARLFPAAPQQRQPSGFSWLQFLVGGTCAALLCVGLLLTLPNQRTNLVTATLAAEGQNLQFLAEYDGRSLLLSRLEGTEPEPGKDYELWLIVENDPPVSLGLIPGQRTLRRLLVLPEGSTLAVSLEPNGGSKTGAPTGPILVTGVVDA